MKKKKTPKDTHLERLSTNVSNAAGSSGAFVVSAGVILAWLISGPLFNFSDTWQLVINTGTTIITFLMVFLIQRSQNKESIAVNLKLNELLATHAKASNRLVSVEDLTEDELKVLRKFYASLSELSKKERSMHETHSIEEAMEQSEIKYKK